MGSHLDRGSQSLGNFLEDELPAFIAFSSGAQAHLDKFRSFLHQYHVQRYGYWPPPEGSQFPNSLHKSMHLDFLGLYNYLVDRTSNNSMQSETLTDSGSVSLVQKVNIFNQGYGYLPLPHPLPLLPDTFSYKQAHRRRLSTVFNLKSSKGFRSGWNDSARSSLRAAANTKDTHILDRSLVKAYRAFERENVMPQDGLTLQEEREVRWILIYSILQVLIAATRAPAGILPWRDEPHAQPAPSTFKYAPNISQPAMEHSPSRHPRLNDMNGTGPQNIDTSLSTTSDFEICQGYDLETTHSNVSRSSSSSAKHAGIATAASTIIRTSSSAQQDYAKLPTKDHTIIGSDTQQDCTVEKTSKPSFCEIIVHAYGNGLNVMYEDMEPITKSQLSLQLPPSPVSSSESSTDDALESSSHDSFSDDSVSNYSVSDYSVSLYSISDCSFSDDPMYKVQDCNTHYSTFDLVESECPQ
jgi:hypothetical protein